MKPFSSSNTQRFAWLTVGYLALTICAVAVNYSFIAYLEFERLQPQSYYLIDAYYYYHLGNVIVEAINTGRPFWDTILFYTPNYSSVGVVTVSTLMSFVLGNLFLINILFCIVYLLITYRMLQKVSLNKSLFILSFVGLLPYLFIISKESLLVLAYLTLILALYTQSFWERILYFFTFILLSICARPEFILICVISYLLFRVVISKRRWLYFSLLILIALFSPLIAYINNIAFAFQVSAMEVGTGQCNFVVFDVCVELGEYNLNEYVSRFLLYFTFPIKWIIDLISFLFFESFFAYAFVIKFFYFLSTLTILYLLYMLPRLHFDLKKLYFFLVPFVYMGIYSSLFFYQGARQFSVVVMLLAIAFSINVKQKRRFDDI